ncbi:MAG: excinuclease ABC subunit UvrC [Desulfobacterales bacterium]|nr:excinuclease ABC subunit UvrC [Desulfobacterales bacterium]
MKNNLSEKYKEAPNDPGVYLMKDNTGKIIYVGKALNIKQRLASYFVNQRHDLKTGILIKKIIDFETIVTRSDHEAYILESNLIKEYQPRYNVLLKDGKNYPYLKIDRNEKYPPINVVRKIKKDKAFYFGPYSSANSVRQTLKQIHKIFKLRKCKKNQFNNRSRPCLNYQIKACLGPCCNNVPKDEYDNIIKDTSLFLKGKGKDVITRLKQVMESHAAQQNFEKAAELRDTIFAIEKTLERQCVVSVDLEDRDVIALSKDESKAVVTILKVRSGYLVDAGDYVFDSKMDTSSEILSAFVTQFYEKAPFLPSTILIQEKIESIKIIEDVFSENKGTRVKIIVPQKGDKKRLIEMAINNADKKLKNIALKKIETENLLIALKNLLKMDYLPKRVECFDNSNISGQHAVSSMVVFTNGEPDKNFYRKYIIRDNEHHDDYAYMQEVLTRRYSNKDMEMPDLLLVDGGKGQISIAVSVLQELEIFGDFMVAGIAKKDADKGEKQDKIYIPGRSNPLNINQYQNALYFLERIRDEAHRTAITFQRKRRQKKGQVSFLDNVPMIGAKRKQALLKHYKGVTQIKNASIEELSSLPTMNTKAAKAVIKAIKER